MSDRKLYQAPHLYKTGEQRFKEAQLARQQHPITKREQKPYVESEPQAPTVIPCMVCNGSAGNDCPACAGSGWQEVT